MSLQRMPNGEYVNIADGTPPAVVARIRAQYRAQPARAPAPVSRQEQRTRDYQAQLERSNPRGPLAGVVNGLQSLTHEASFHLDDVVSSAGTAITAPDVWSGKRRLQDEYGAAREGMRRHRQEMSDQTPVSTALGGVMGMVATPTRLVARGARAVAPRAVEAIAPRLASRPIRSAAMEGATQAGITSLADTDGDVGRAAQAAVLGGGLGAAGGAVLGAGAGAIRAIGNRGAARAENVAYDKIAAMLNRTRDETGQAFSPAAAVREIEDATARGTPTTLGDLSPEMQGMRGEFARRTSLPSAGEVAAQAEQRLATAAERFNARIRGTIQSKTGDDALDATAAINASRKADAAVDYAPGGVLDTPLAPTPHLINAVSTNPTPDMQDALKAARRVFANAPDLGPFTVKVQQGRNVVEVPTLRAFNEIKIAFDDIIENGIKHLPDGTKIASGASRSASVQLRALKDQIAKSNPKYEELLGRQRDAFERLEGIAVGKKFMEQMRDTPRELLANLTAKGARNPDEVRTGLIDALLSGQNKGSPIKLLRQWERNPQQRAVLVHIMGGPKKFNEFSKFMRRELRAMQADALTVRKSNSPALNDFAEHGEQTVGGSAPFDVMRGFAYGGPAGGISAGARVLDRIKNGMGPEAQEATLRLLNSDGKGLETGVGAARAAREARRQAAMARARAAGKLSGSAAAGFYGTGE